MPSKFVPQIREQILVPDLYVYTLKFEIPQQPIKIKKNMKKNLYSMQLFIADPTIFSKKIEINFLPMKT